MKDLSFEVVGGPSKILLHVMNAFKDMGPREHQQDPARET